MARPINRTAPTRALTREDICSEALALVDQEGLEALSMRRLGARLGIEAMSLYHHVRDKAELLDALHAAVLGKLEPEGVRRSTPERAFKEDWRALLGGLARALRSALLAHPNVLPLFTRRDVRAPEALGTIERVRASMVGAHFFTDDIVNAIYVVGMFTIGHVIFETSNGENDQRAPRRDTTFRFGLEALLEGVERQRLINISPGRRAGAKRKSNTASGKHSDSSGKHSDSSGKHSDSSGARATTKSKTKSRTR